MNKKFNCAPESPLATNRLHRAYKAIPGKPNSPNLLGRRPETGGGSETADEQSHISDCLGKKTQLC